MHYPPYSWAGGGRGAPPWARPRITRSDEREELKDRLAELREEIEAIERRLDEVGT
jgi:hypothetical protein